jgi:hypothetical protein
VDDGLEQVAGVLRPSVLDQPDRRRDSRSRELSPAGGAKLTTQFYG